ncbi:MAG: Hsp20/alpha crystallin family protein [Christensenellaceae bacterium]|jgi:HSP20 family protein|nr:Hsp20/alpha crystallin family protein [Christensenellaceae bacterium]
MAGLIPFNRNTGLARSGDYGTFYNMLDDFFSDNFSLGRNLLKDTFKIDIEETEKSYKIEAELAGIKKEEVDLNIDDDCLSITINHVEKSDANEKNYIHKERKSTSMSRRIKLSNAQLDKITAKLEDGVLSVVIPKKDNESKSRKINIE